MCVALCAPNVRALMSPRLGLGTKTNNSHGNSTVDYQSFKSQHFPAIANTIRGMLRSVFGESYKTRQLYRFGYISSVSVYKCL